MVHVVFTPYSQTLYRMPVKCSTTEGRVVEILCTGKGVEAPVQLESNRLRLAACAIGDCKIHTLCFVNTSRSQEQTVSINIPDEAFFDPDNPAPQGGAGGRRGSSSRPTSPDKRPSSAGSSSGVHGRRMSSSSSGSVDSTAPPPSKKLVSVLSVVPRVASIPPGGKAFVTVTFEAHPPRYQAKKGDGTEGSMFFDDGLSQGSRRPSSSSLALPKSPRDIAAPAAAPSVSSSISGRSTARTTASAVLAKIPPLDEDWSVHEKWTLPWYIQGVPDPCHVDIFTTVVQAPLLCLHGFDSKQSVDFGDVAAGKSRVIHLRVVNRGDSRTKLTTAPLDPFGPFELLSAVDDVPGRELRELAVRFKPLQAVGYQQRLVIESSNTNRLILKLSGRGVSPLVEVTPFQEELDMGDVLVGESSLHELSVRNCSPFDVPFTVTLEKLNTLNNNGKYPVIISPISEVVPAGEIRTISLTFSPDRVLREYAGNLIVEWGGKNAAEGMKGHCQMRLRARCWSQALFARYPEEKEKEVGSDLDFDAEPQTPTFTLHLPKTMVGETVEGRILVGNVIQGVGTDRKGVNGEVQCEGLPPAAVAEGFSVDPAKMTLEVGSTKEISFRFSPTEKAVSKLPIRGIDVPCETTLEFTFKGGFPAPSPPLQSFRVHLVAVAQERF